MADGSKDAQQSPTQMQVHKSSFRATVAFALASKAETANVLCEHEVCRQTMSMSSCVIRAAFPPDSCRIPIGSVSDSCGNPVGFLLPSFCSMPVGLLEFLCGGISAAFLWKSCGTRAGFLKDPCKIFFMISAAFL